MHDEQVEEISDSEIEESQYKFIILGLSIFMFFIVIFFGAIMLSSCSLNLQNVMTSGEATGVGESEEDQKIDPTTSLESKLPLGL